MSDEFEIQYGAGGVPYVGGKKGSAPEPKGQYAAAVESAASEEIIEEPEVKVTVTEDDRPLTDEQVVQKVTGRKRK